MNFYDGFSPSELYSFIVSDEALSTSGADYSEIEQSDSWTFLKCSNLASYSVFFLIKSRFISTIRFYSVLYNDGTLLSTHFKLILCPDRALSRL